MQTAEMWKRKVGFFVSSAHPQRACVPVGVRGSLSDSPYVVPTAKRLFKNKNKS